MIITKERILGKGLIKPTEKRIKLNAEQNLSKRRGEILRQRKKIAGIDECLWTVSGHPDVIDTDEMIEAENW